MNKEKELIDKLIDLAFAEDIGDGDHTTLSCIPATAMGKSKMCIRDRTNTNQHAAFLRMLSRGATFEIDGALSNPAGLAFLPNPEFRIISRQIRHWLRYERNGRLILIYFADSAWRINPYENEKNTTNAVDGCLDVYKRQR